MPAVRDYVGAIGRELATSAEVRSPERCVDRGAPVFDGKDLDMSWQFERVVLVRHVETEWNVVGRRQGRLDSPLTRKGSAQADALARSIHERGIDRIYSSPLGRARLTAAPVALRLRLPVVVLDDLAELDHGTLAGLTDGEIEDRHPGELARRAERKYDWRFPGGESYSDGDARAGRALRRIERDGAARPLLVTHEMLARMLIRRLLGLPPYEALKWNLAHGEAIELITDGDALVQPHDIG